MIFGVRQGEENLLLTVGFVKVYRNRRYKKILDTTFFFFFLYEAKYNWGIRRGYGVQVRLSIVSADLCVFSLV